MVRCALRPVRAVFITMDSLIDRYLTGIRIEGGLAGNTLDAYRRDLGKLHAYLSTLHIQHPGDVTRQTMSGFLAHLKRSKLSPTSIARCMAAVRGFYRLLVRERIVQENPLQNFAAPRRWTRLPRTLTQRDVSQLLDLKGRSRDPEETRDTAMVELLYATGLRVSELVGLGAVPAESGGRLSARDRQRRQAASGPDRRCRPAQNRNLSPDRPRSPATTPSLPTSVCDTAWKKVEPPALLETAPIPSSARRNCLPDFSPCAQAFICDSSSGTWGRSPFGSGDAGACQDFHHADLYPRGTASD